MLKTISAALLAVSVVAAPALAANSGAATHAPAIKNAQAKPSVLNANATMSHYRKHIRHHSSHKRIGALKTQQVSKSTHKHVTAATKRG
jgi:hypothetical protein